MKTRDYWKVDVLGNVEREIIRILLLYGNELKIWGNLMKSNEKEIIEVSEFKSWRFFSKDILKFTGRWSEFMSPIFELYEDLMNYYLQNENSGIEKYINHLQSGVPEKWLP
jgi:DNA primase